uniref:Methyltransferase type 11 domain-containing protein n=1 Tax=Romanomermis culicivorax TaxID=13658 RepID=A0A915JCK2_ROMCU
MLLSSFGQSRYPPSVSFRYSSFSQTRLYNNRIRNSSKRVSRFLNNIQNHQDMVDNGVDNLTDIESDERSRIDDKYMLELVHETLRFANFKNTGSLLVIGGSNWQFAKSVWRTSNMPSCVYADCDPISLRSADSDDEALTVECDLRNADDISKLGKYDGIVVKDALEHLFLDPGEDIKEQISEFFGALYKVLKYGARALLIFRSNPLDNLPLPERIAEKLSEKAMDFLNFDFLKSCAQEHEFEIKHRALVYHVSMDKEDYGKILTKSNNTLSLVRHFYETISQNEDADMIGEFLDKQEGDTVQFDEKLELILLTKEMLDD